MTDILRPARSLTVAPTSWAPRPRRSSFETMSVSPSRILCSSAANSGRWLALVLPLIVSANQKKTIGPATNGAGLCQRLPEVHSANSARCRGQQNTKHFQHWPAREAQVGKASTRVVRREMHKLARELKAATCALSGTRTFRRYPRLYRHRGGPKRAGLPPDLPVPTFSGELSISQPYRRPSK